MRKDTETCLVMPPFSDDIFPSLALGLLQSCLLREGISCRVDYANTRFHRLLGLPLSRKLTALANYFVAEAVFAPLAGFAPRRDLGELARWLKSIRSRVRYGALTARPAPVTYALRELRSTSCRLDWLSRNSGGSGSRGCSP